MGAVSYADDITLLSPSLHGLNRMLEICAKFADNFDITFNSKKTLCIKFGESLNGKKCATTDVKQKYAQYLTLYNMTCKIM